MPQLYVRELYIIYVYEREAHNLLNKLGNGLWAPNLTSLENEQKRPISLIYSQSLDIDKTTLSL